MTAIGRNQPCPCGSGRKYKKCCALKKDDTPLGMRIGVGLLAVVLLGGLVVFLTSIDDYEPGASSTPGAGRVWSEEHQHWH